MIKVNCKDSNEPVKEKYPCLKRSINYGRIVLFSGPEIGYELKGPTAFCYAETWAEKDFKLYTGTIELSNEL